MLRPLKQQPLPARVYHVLNGHDCQSMADVGQKGALGLKRIKGLGNKGLALIIKLFDENGCGSLFA